MAPPPPGARTIDDPLGQVRSRIERARYGEVPGAIAVDRTVLEWRLDPARPHPAGQRRRPRRHRALRAVGVIGGVEAWAAQGLPVVGVRRSDAGA